ncbi:MAG: formylglycine-generating enzyme family protein [Gemmatimonadota bacterium]|nr:formylglycine-generating enzyme family protein [Gemmatimonadota bacterium]
MNAVVRNTLAGMLLLAVVLPARAQEEPPPGEFFSDCPECPEMVVVPAGSFTMGTFEGQAFQEPDNKPAHRVTIESPFAVGVFEVTFAEWDACVRAGGCEDYRPEDEGWGRDRFPVIHVSWEDAREYVRWLSRRTGQGYRLLSEAEWEYVARAGTRRHAWSYGRKRSRLCQFAVERSFHSDCPDYGTAPVGTVEPNPFGLYDVLGNVWEWTEDCWHDNYVGAPDDGTAWRSGDCSYRVLRGGSWYWDEPGSGSAVRGWSQIGFRGKNIGFRVARTMN